MKSQALKTIWLVTLAVIAVASQAAVPRGAFIRKPVKTVADLVSHVKTDPIVMDRMVRHFRLTPAQIANYFSTLHVARLENEGVYLVFNVHEDNVIRGRYFKVPKGTLVFSDSNGRPILKHECGNPMVLRLPTLVAESTPTGPAGPRDTVMGDVAASEHYAIVEPSVTGVPTAPPIVAPGGTVVTGGFVSGGGGFGFLPIFLGLGGLTSFLHKEECETNPVPEPATMLVLAAGVAAIAAKKRKKQ